MTPAPDTILAVSSPPGRSARGLIRLSGPAAFAVLDELTEAQHPVSRRACPGAHAARHAGTSPAAYPRTLTPARLRPPLPPLPVLVARFPGPHSYTGEDAAELQLPGHPALLDRVLAAAVAHGARLAEPGEFTFRAYLAARLDLTEAEGIAATIAAVSDAQLAAAGHLRTGELARFAAAHVETLGRLLALVEAGIDFTDQEDVVPIAPADLAAGVDTAHRDLQTLLGRSRAWGNTDALPRVVLLGPPSAGKSTLFNALLGRPRAVVDPRPGTTRDVLEEALSLSPTNQDETPSSRDATRPRVPGTRSVPAIPDEPTTQHEILLVDLAGLDHAAAPLDRDIQAAADRAVATADLILQLGDTPRPLPPGVSVLRVQTRSDLDPPDPAADVHVSGTTGENLDALRRLIAERLGDRLVSVNAEALALQPRHEAALHSAAAALAKARATLDPDAPALDAPELVAAPLRDALDHLAALGGRLTPDDVIGRVFATFCVGK